MTSAHCSKDSNTDQKVLSVLLMFALLIIDLEIYMYHNELKILTPFGPLLFVQEEKR